MAVAMLDPTEKQLALDPAHGTDGFLITAVDHGLGRSNLRWTLCMAIEEVSGYAAERDSFQETKVKPDGTFI